VDTQLLDQLAKLTIVVAFKTALILRLFVFQQLYRPLQLMLAGRSTCKVESRNVKCQYAKISSPYHLQLLVRTLELLVNSD